MKVTITTHSPGSRIDSLVTICTSWSECTIVNHTTTIMGGKGSVTMKSYLNMRWHRQTAYAMCHLGKQHTNLCGYICTGWVKKNVPSDKIWHYCTKSWDKWNPFSGYWSWCTCRFAVENSIDRSRNVWVISAWKRRTSFAPTQGLHFSSLWNVLSDMRFHCFNELWMWKIWKNIMLNIPVTVLLLLFIFFIHMTKYVNCSICVYLAHNH